MKNKRCEGKKVSNKVLISKKRKKLIFRIIQTDARKILLRLKTYSLRLSKTFKKILYGNFIEKALDSEEFHA
jgi:hypothetical protein